MLWAAGSGGVRCRARIRGASIRVWDSRLGSWAMGRFRAQSLKRFSLGFRVEGLGFNGSRV